MILRLDVSEEEPARAVLALQRRSYRVEADLIGYEGIPPLKEELDALRACSEEFHGWMESGRLAGAISFKRAGGEIDIYRMMVDPAFFRRGIARELLRWASGLAGVSRVLVSTAAANLPARRLYEGEGFRLVEEVRREDGLRIVRFAKDLVIGGPTP
jgi:ribosomal protein S18 acetylase RimI-like enzyme